MLKFRVTNSMRARRAAEAQRKALEDKLQLEWAWKPMAAMMNERQTDLVYWIPPLYRNNIKTAGSRVRRKSLAHRSSLANRSSLSNRLPYTHLQAAHMYSQLHSSQRKKKLSRTRAKLAAQVSFEDPTDPDSGGLGGRKLSRRRTKVAQQVSFEDQTDAESTPHYSTRRKTTRRRGRLLPESSLEDPTDADSSVLDSRSEWQDAKDEDNESGIHDETLEINVDDMSLLNVQSIQEEEIAPVAVTGRRRLGEHRRVKNISGKPKVPPKPDFITKSFEAIDKPKPAPTLLRLLEKVSHIHSPSIKPNKTVKPIKPELKKIGRRGSENKSSLKGKVKRPSVKIYRNPATRLSGRRAKAAMDDENDIENQCVIVSVDHGPPPREVAKLPPKASPKVVPKVVSKIHSKSSQKTHSKDSPKTHSKDSSKTHSKESTKTHSKDPSKTHSKDSPKPHSKESQKLHRDSLKGHLKDSPKTHPKTQQEQLQELFKEGPAKADDAEFRNAQLQMILRLLAQLYEEKVSRQDSEIQNLKMRIQTQDKLMKQMAHVVLELKEEVSKIKIQGLAAAKDTRPQVPTNVLNIKVGGEN